MRKIIYYTLLILFIIIFLVSAVLIVNYLVSSKEQSDFYDGLASIRQENQADRPPIGSKDETTPDDPDDSTEPTEPQILDEFQPLYEMNSDLVGWIEIPGTKVNYPVVQPSTANLDPYRKHNNECYFYNEWALPDYYLKHTFYGECSDWGAIYVQEGCNVFTPSDNITIYGHHMMDGSMFSGLDGYKKQSFWESHQFVYFDTLYERHVYQVIAAFKTSGNYSEGFAYHTYDDMNEAEFNRFISTVMSLAYYDTGLTAQYGDRLITLSTCEYTQDNGRHVVIAKRVA